MTVMDRPGLEGNVQLRSLAVPLPLPGRIVHPANPIVGPKSAVHLLSSDPAYFRSGRSPRWVALLDPSRWLFASAFHGRRKLTKSLLSPHPPHTPPSGPPFPSWPAPPPPPPPSGPPFPSWPAPPPRPAPRRRDADRARPRDTDACGASSFFPPPAPSALLPLWAEEPLAVRVWCLLN